MAYPTFVVWSFRYGCTSNDISEVRHQETLVHMCYTDAQNGDDLSRSLRLFSVALILTGSERQIKVCRVRHLVIRIPLWHGRQPGP